MCIRLSATRSRTECPNRENAYLSTLIDVGEALTVQITLPLGEYYPREQAFQDYIYSRVYSTTSSVTAYVLHIIIRKRKINQQGRTS